MTDDQTVRPGVPAGKAYHSTALTVFFDASRCRHFAECVRGLPEVFDVHTRPWITPDGADPGLVAEVVRRCPSGALHYLFPDGRGEEPEPVTTVTPIAGGPLLLRGNLRIAGVSDAGDIRESRMAACACGRTSQAPFCDGACEAGQPG